jgi:hypothetical protein
MFYEQVLSFCPTLPLHFPISTLLVPFARLSLRSCRLSWLTGLTGCDFPLASTRSESGFGLDSFPAIIDNIWSSSSVIRTGAAPGGSIGARDGLMRKRHIVLIGADGLGFGRGVALERVYGIGQ